MRLAAGAAIFALGLAFGGVAPAAPACHPANPAAKIVALDLADEATKAGLARSLEFGLTPDTYPFEEIAKASEPCELGTFAVGDNTAHLRGNPAVPRWGSIDGIDQVAFVLALMPNPEAAAAATGNTLQLKPSDMLYAATLASKDVRLVFAFYDDIPSDAVLLALAEKVMTGQAKPLIGFDSRTGDISFLGTPL